MADTERDLTALRWDEEYRAGRYATEPPLSFVGVIARLLEAEPEIRQGRGLYVGCGNGRNYLPLADIGLDLYGLDISSEALRQLRERRPGHADRLICKDFLRFESPEPFDYLIALQVFQHGALPDTRSYFQRVAALLRPGGLFFLRVNSVSTDIYYPHEVIGRSNGGGLTVRYLDGPKRGLAVHFYGREELQQLTESDFCCVNEPREDVIVRARPKTGSWAQWEAIWARRPPANTPIRGTIPANETLSGPCELVPVLEQILEQILPEKPFPRSPPHRDWVKWCGEPSGTVRSPA